MTDESWRFLKDFFFFLNLYSTFSKTYFWLFILKQDLFGQFFCSKLTYFQYVHASARLCKFMCVHYISISCSINLKTRRNSNKYKKKKKINSLISKFCDSSKTLRYLTNTLQHDSPKSHQRTSAIYEWMRQPWRSKGGIIEKKWNKTSTKKRKPFREQTVKCQREAESFSFGCEQKREVV